MQTPVRDGRLQAGWMIIFALGIVSMPPSIVIAATLTSVREEVYRYYCQPAPHGSPIRAVHRRGPVIVGSSPPTATPCSSLLSEARGCLVPGVDWLNERVQPSGRFSNRPLVFSFIAWDPDQARLLRCIIVPRSLRDRVNR